MTVITAEHLGKKYTIGHQRQGSYLALRDVLAHSARGVWQRVRHPLSPNQETTDLEEIWALKDVNFEIKQGERVGIIGRNGAGKSTLLKILSRITHPTTGRIHLKGRVASLLEVGTGFHPELTGRENIYLNGAILGMTRQEIKRKFDEIVAFAEIEKFLDTPVKRYSSGMYVRLAFAVAAHLEPEILLVDEVLAVGDAQFQKKCLGKMEDVAKEGRTVLFVSHNMTAITGLCHRAILLTLGYIQNDDIASKIVQEYLTTIQNTTNIPLHERTDREGNGIIKIVNIGLGVSHNLKSGFWVTGEDAFIEMKYVCISNQIYRNIEVAIAIRKLDMSPLLYFGTKVVGFQIERVCRTGKFICHIPRLPIEPGRYFLFTEVMQNGIIVDLIKGAAVIEVAEGDFYKTGVLWPYGGFVCEYSWVHESDGESP